MKKVLYVGSFDPLTKWHLDIVERAAQTFWELVIWIWKNPNKKTMFSLHERIEMITKAVDSQLSEVFKIKVIPYAWLLVDFAYEQWISIIVRGVRDAEDLQSESLLHRVWESQGLWIETVYFLSREEQSHISSSVTKAILQEQGDISQYVPLNVKHFLEARMLGQYLMGWNTEWWSEDKSFMDTLLGLWKARGVEMHIIDIDALANELEEKEKSDSLFEKKLLFKLRQAIKGKNGVIILKWSSFAHTTMAKVSNNHICLVESAENSDYHDDNKTFIVPKNESFNSKKSFFQNQITQDRYGELIDIREIKSIEKTDNQVETLFDRMLSCLDIFGELRISSLLSQRGLKENFSEIYWVKSLYDSFERAYHNRFHITHCLDQLYQVKKDIDEESFMLLFLALIFHDVVYDTSAVNGENEYKSAEYAEKKLNDLWMDGDKIQKIKSLILLTASHTVPWSDEIWKYMIDIDLSIMWKEWKEYERYMKAIRAEYAHYPDQEYLAGRLNFLNTMLERQIFQTLYFRNKYENQAKENLKKEREILMNQQ